MRGRRPGRRRGGGQGGRVVDLAWRSAIARRRGSAERRGARHRRDRAAGAAWREAEGVQLERERRARDGSTGLVESEITMKRSAAAATIFSRGWAPPPPLTSQRSGSTWSAPSIAMSSGSSGGKSSTARPSSCAWVGGGRRGGDAAQTQPAVRQRRQQVGDGRAGAQADGHPVARPAAAAATAATRFSASASVSRGRW